MNSASLSSERKSNTALVSAIKDEMTSIHRPGEAKRSADAVVHQGTAHRVEVAETPTKNARGQIAEVLQHTDATLALLGAERTRLAQILIYRADLANKSRVSTRSGNAARKHLA